MSDTLRESDTPGEPCETADVPAGLVSQRDACSVLLEFAETIPDSLETELYAYVQMLDHAMNPRRA